MRLLLCAILAFFGSAVCLFAQAVYVKPYIQPGDGRGLSGSDVKVIGWLTDQTPGEFVVEYTVPGVAWRAVRFERLALDFARSRPKPITPRPERGTLKPATSLEELDEAVIEASAAPVPERERHFFKYSALLPDLPMDSSVTYRVSLRGRLVREATFRTRASADKPIRCVLVGDLANGKSEQNGIAWRIAQQRPDFLVALGDIVYSGGRVGEYLQHFWPTYNNASQPGPGSGAPLMATIPFYPVLGNHDVDARKLPAYPDAFGAYYFFNVPLTGPAAGAWRPALGRDQKVAAQFRKNVGAQYPAMNVYSFDYGPAHFVALDSNSYTTDVEKLVPWLEKDLGSSSQRWKFVCFHSPAFHTAKEHYTEQKMRLLQPVFERTGVDAVFAGHVHNYQRSKPLRFTPNPPRRDRWGRINGDFVLDESFDGTKDTTPQGVIHIVSGGGGAKLYSVDFAKTVEFLRRRQRGNWVPFTAKYYADKHSFSLMDLTPSECTLRQINIEGQEIDRITITKP